MPIPNGALIFDGRAEIRLLWTQTPFESLPDSAVPTANRQAPLPHVRSGPGLNYEPFSSLRNG